MKIHEREIGWKKNCNGTVRRSKWFGFSMTSCVTSCDQKSARCWGLGMSKELQCHETAALPNLATSGDYCILNRIDLSLLSRILPSSVTLPLNNFLELDTGHWLHSLWLLSCGCNLWYCLADDLYGNGQKLGSWNPLSLYAFLCSIYIYTSSIISTFSSSFLLKRRCGKLPRL